MKGQLVVIRDVSGSLLVRRIWESCATGVFIHSEEEWRKRMEGKQSLDPVGFPICDVFQYDDSAKEQIGSSAPDWSKLTRFLPVLG
jgi:hypothetical protein